MYDARLAEQTVKQAFAELMDHCLRRLGTNVVYGPMITGRRIRSLPIVLDQDLMGIDLSVLSRSFYYSPVSDADLFRVFERHARQLRNKYPDSVRPDIRALLPNLEHLGFEAEALIQLMGVAAMDGHRRLRPYEKTGLALACPRGVLKVTSEYLEWPGGFRSFPTPLAYSPLEVVTGPHGAERGVDPRLALLCTWLKEKVPMASDAIDTLMVAAQHLGYALLNEVVSLFDIRFMRNEEVPPGTETSLPSIFSMIFNNARNNDNPRPAAPAPKPEPEEIPPETAATLRLMKMIR